MRKALFLTLACMLLAAPLLADDWSQSFNVAGTPDVRVRTNDGAVKVYAGGTGRIDANVHAVGYERARDYDVQVNQVGNRVSIEVQLRPNRTWFFNWGRTGGRSLEIRVAVPRESNLELQSGDGSINLQDVAGRVRATTNDGSISARRLNGDIELRTGDGSVSAEELDGGLQARTGDGSMRIGGRFHTLTLETGDGSVDVHVAAGSKMDRGWSLTTGDGALSLALPAAFAGELDVVTHGGRIDSDFPGDMREENSRLQARLNNGAHLFRVRTGDGSIRIRKQ